jgi:hypothetical protein
VSDPQIEAMQEWAEREGVSLPAVELPSGNVTITDCAEKLFSLIAPRQQMFGRGGVVVVLIRRDDGLLQLEILRAAAARSAFEKYGRLFAWRSGAKGEPVLKPANCPHDMADALLQSEEAKRLLPRVQGLLNCPIIREFNGELGFAGRGYDTATNMLITAGEAPPDVELGEAATALWGLLGDFEFQSEGDKARAMASLLSPALKTGGFLSGKVPADVAEADQSQSGKTYRQRMIAAIYNEKPSMVTSREGGVGSVDESLNQQLVAGRPFIQLDNFRGRFESAHLEAFLTADGMFSCRVPHRGEVSVPADSYFIFLTSNGVDTTRDLANRSLIIRIRKKPLNYAFTRYPEGGLLEHVRAKQTYYLGCVFAVIREWHRRGKPRSAETRHDFREWVQMLDWIVQNLLGGAPIMDGHRQAQERVSNPAMVWLRNVALQIEQAGDLNRSLSATDLHELCDSADIGIPGLKPGADENKGRKLIGTVMGKLFKDGDEIEIDGFRVVREERYVERDNPNDGGAFRAKTYTVTRTNNPGTAATQPPQ